ncbi:MAG: tRNA (N6-isopentenyl adenosine(37)-C2)-methylthiotransferase MiaB [Desulfobacterales bacterium]|nr:tRNA (N6-isopentenyl adenosine(37)-C2)-methylthiotransferase MiaB [Desulfobacterales bacterium]
MMYLYVQTIGCQMNVYDSEQIIDGLKPLGYQITPVLEMADVVIVNTCTIREKAQHKAFSFLGRLAELKRKKPRLIVGVGGCVAQQEGRRLLKRMPQVDLVFGTHAVGRLPELIRDVRLNGSRRVDVQLSDKIDEIMPAPADSHGPEVTAFVTIMRGCDNYCSYCVVPYVRGIETSRDAENILLEIRKRVVAGVREITLLGQNVNSYGKKEGLCSFPQLLERVNRISGLVRIRFTTSHPKDLSDDLMAAFHKLDRLCRHIHLPVQSGSNRILKKMNRKYNRQQYFEKVEKLRKICPDVAITSDIIVGFPGETDADFTATLDLIRRVNFDNLYAFQYSDRPPARAAAFPGKVSEKEKKERLQNVLDLQGRITALKNQDLIGTTQEVLVEGFSKKQTIGAPVKDARQLIGRDMNKSGEIVQWTGRTPMNKIVNFVADADAPFAGEMIAGRIIQVKIEKAFAHSLWGRPDPVQNFSQSRKGDNSYAA